jgi:hypothetical protein
MIRSFSRLVGLAFLVLAVPESAPVAAAAVQAPKQISVSDAAPFAGDWTLALQGPNGPGNFFLSITTANDKVAAEIASDAVAKQPISTISLVDKTLVLGYSFTWEGNAVDATVSLTPDKDAKMAAQIDFAGGAYVMTGTATKKEKDKEK